MKRLAMTVMLLTTFLYAFVLTCPTPASALIYTIEATSASSQVTGFTLTYSDTGDGRFGLQDGDVVLSFSGFVYEPTLPNPMLLTEVLSSPVYDAVDAPVTSGLGCGLGVVPWDQYSDKPHHWEFYAPGWYAYLAPWDTSWTYEQQVVPIPASGLLLGSGLIPLAWFRRRKRTGE